MAHIRKEVIVPHTQYHPHDVPTPEPEEVDADLSADDAHGILYTVLSEDGYLLMVTEHGWTVERWLTWVVDTCHRQFFPDADEVRTPLAGECGPRRVLGHQPTGLTVRGCRTAWPP